MKNKLITVVVIALFSGLPGHASAQAAIDARSFREFQIESAHSAVGFSIGFVGLPVRGTFDEVKGTIVYAAHRPEASAVTIAIPTASLHTGSEHRDGHLKSSDFFDAKQFPVILFQSTRITRERGKLVMHGNLRMHGVTRQISFPFTESPSSPLSEPHGSTLIQFSGALRLARKDFGITGGSAFNSWFDDVRQAAMADSVDVALEITGWDPDNSRSHKYDAPLARIEKDGIAATTARIRAMYKANPDTLKNSEWDFRQIAQALEERGKYSEAREILIVSTEVFPNSADVQAALARAYELLGNKPEAVAHADRALALDPSATRALELKRRLGA
jgi:polyisoprenoid-binding protein YceI